MTANLSQPTLRKCANRHPVDLRSVDAAIRRYLTESRDTQTGLVIDLHESNVGRRKIALTDGEYETAFDAFTGKQVVRIIIDSPVAFDALARLRAPELGPGRTDLAPQNAQELIRRALLLAQEGVTSLTDMTPAHARDLAARLRLFQSASAHWLANLDAMAEDA